MYTATKDLMLPTTVTGSWPRPVWYTGNLYGKPFSTAMADVAFREQFVDAVSTIISDQETAGLDILTNGDYHLAAWHEWLGELAPVAVHVDGTVEQDLVYRADNRVAKPSTWLLGK